MTACVQVRLLLVPLLCIVCTLAAAVLTMYPVSCSMTVSGQAPSLMLASALAMSIDYSLFLLSRFSEEVHAGHGAARAVEVMLATSGHTVAVSGSTLTLCFLGMLLMPVHTIQTMGLAAAITVVYATQAADDSGRVAGATAHCPCPPGAWLSRGVAPQAAGRAARNGTRVSRPPSAQGPMGGSGGWEATVRPRGLGERPGPKSTPRLSARRRSCWHSR